MQIALYKSRGILSRTIQRFSRGEYTHTSVLFDDGTVIDATFIKGVAKSDKISNTLNKKTIVDLFEVSTTPEQDRIISEFLHRQLGKKYDVWSVFGFVLFTSNEGRKSYGRWFCSELVFASFAKAGIQLLEHVEAWKVSPTMLRFSNKLVFKRSFTLKDFS